VTEPKASTKRPSDVPTEDRGLAPGRLHARGLSMQLGGKPLFEGLGLDLRSGELLTVIGPNGSGKSTLLRVLAGLARPDAGAVALDGRPIARWAARERARRVAYLPQATPLYHDLRVDEIVMLGRTPHLGPWRGPGQADEAAVAKALGEVGLRTLATRRMSTLSGGEKQRVMLARMLATGADVLVLDEPTTSLDIGHALDVLGRLRDLARAGHAIVTALHELELARRFGDRSLCLVGDGTHDTGVSDEVLTPELLERTFDVVVRRGEGLRFDAPQR